MHRTRRWLALFGGLVLLAMGSGVPEELLPGAEEGERERVAHAQAQADGDAGWVVELVRPADGTVLGTRELAIVWSVRDAVYGSEPAAVVAQVTLGGQALSPDGEANGPAQVERVEGTSLTAVVAGEGFLRIAVDLLEADGAPAGGHAEATVWVDASAPTILWNDPPGEALLPGPDLPLAGILTDPNLAGAALDLEAATGAPARTVTPDLARLATLNNFRMSGWTGPLEEGVWTGTLRAWDAADPSHATAATRRWVVDGTPPALAWSGAPLQGAEPVVVEELPAGDGAAAYRRLRYEAAWSVAPGAPLELAGLVSDAWTGFTLARLEEATGAETLLAASPPPASAEAAGAQSAAFRLALAPPPGDAPAAAEAAGAREVRALLSATDGAGNLLEAELLLHVTVAAAGPEPSGPPAP
ncbi:MAG: hypothetical protein QJR08_05485, partial [Bacillota bacterium]|nr:hypothetical protein [Bacillota bacterium]